MFENFPTTTVSKKSLPYIIRTLAVPRLLDTQQRTAEETRSRLWTHDIKLLYSTKL